MKKRLLAAFACLCMLLTLLPAAVFAGEGEGDPGAAPKTVTVEPGNYDYAPNYRDYWGAPDAEFAVERDAEVTITGVTANQQGETTALAYGTEYRVSAWSGNLIIDSDYMSALPLNSVTELTASLSDGSTAVFTITVPEVYVIRIVSDPADVISVYCEALNLPRADEFYVQPGDAIVLEPVCPDYYAFISWVLDGQEMDMEHPIEVSPTGDMTLELSARMLSFGLQADPASLEFGSAAVGYTQPEGQELTFTNNGEMPMMIATDGVENYEATLLDGLPPAPATGSAGSAPAG